MHPSQNIPKNKSIPYLFCTEQTKNHVVIKEIQITREGNEFLLFGVWLFGDYPARYRKDPITHVNQNAPCFWPIRFVDEAVFATPPFTRKFHLLGDIWILGWNTITISPKGGPKNGGKHGVLHSGNQTRLAGKSRVSLDGFPITASILSGRFLSQPFYYGLVNLLWKGLHLALGARLGSLPNPFWFCNMIHPCCNPSEATTAHK